MAAMLNNGVKLKSGESLMFPFIRSMYHEHVACDFVSHVLFGRTPDLLQEFLDARELKTNKTCLEYFSDQEYGGAAAFVLRGFLKGFEKNRTKNPMLCQQLIEQTQEAIVKLEIAEAQREDGYQRRKTARYEQTRLVQYERIGLWGVDRSQPDQEIDPSLKSFIEGRERTIKSSKSNKILSSEFGLDSEALSLMCPLSLDFPEIPVFLEGHLFDYLYLKPDFKNGYSKNPLNNNLVPINQIQPAYYIQNQLDKLIEKHMKDADQEIKKSPGPK
jgi:hypothetical protein